ncbi:MAG: mechanosensitive ion channel family protein, partial [Bacteroidales bacterium]|nr:mechanosensitive ion channel family protein [Bacteroidales bacterium]
MNKKKLLVSAVLMLFALPMLAVFNEKDLPQTLSVLRFELKQEVAKMEARSTSIRSRERAQHFGMIQLTKRCNELALMLYSQSNDFTMDMTYALQEVTKEYESFHMRRLPFDEIIGSLNQEIDRYSRLVES